MQVRIENQKRYWLRWWEIVLTVVMLAVAISWAFEYRWIASAAAASNAIFWMTKHLRDSARVISVTTLNESSLVITYRSSKEMVIALGEIEAVVNIANKTIIRFYRNEEVQHFELKRSEFDEDSWQQIRRLKSRIGI